VFPTILRAFHLLLKGGGSNIWNREPADFAHITLDSIKDDPAFERMVINGNDNVADAFEWVQVFVDSIWTSAVFEDTLARLVGFMGEELQHERFGDTRPQILIRLFSV
jgi:senataxin